MTNTRLYILDRYLQPVPIGVPGELYIEGPGLARGYLRRPGLTAERFVPNPFGHPGTRLYRTGDLVQFFRDGNIEFLGRTDHQVKIRGYRIELGEIEASLEEHGAVLRCVVLAREDAPGETQRGPGTDKRLVAYVIPRAMPGPKVGELRSFLSEKLPQYMVPSSFVYLDVLPLAPSGKVDRNALPAPDERRPELDGAFVAPRTSVEVGLAEIWAAVLGFDQVGIHDDFFELGGHSLLATVVVSRARDAFGVDIALRTLFETPTIAGLAERVEVVRTLVQGFEDEPEVGGLGRV
jgi:hypothetical protein